MDILIVDDHARVRQELRSLLESYDDVHIAGEASDGREAVRLTEQLQPDIVLMDINMPKMNGIEAMREIAARYPTITIIGLSVNTTGDNHQAMTRAGAATLLAKETAVDHLYDAIRELVKNRETSE